MPLSLPKVFIVIAILLLSLFLRLHNYTVYPQRGATSDEYTYSFLGVSLLTKGIPISWSYYSAYKDRYDLTIRGIYFPIVQPYFDHPPLFGIVVGAWSLLFGHDTFQEIELVTIRIIPILLTFLSSAFVFLLGYRLFDYKSGVWALLIYSTVTIFVMNTRVVFAETLLTLLLLGALYFFMTQKEQMTVGKTLLLGILCGLCLWVKVIGVAVFLILLYLVIYEKIEKKQIFLFIVTFLFFTVLLVGYGMYFNAEVFWQIQSVQASRQIGPQTLLNLFLNPVVVNKIYRDGWYFLGFIALFVCLSDYKKYRYLIVPSFVYLLLLLFSLTKEGSSGWYMIPLFPFMSLATSAILIEGIRKQSWIVFLLLLFVGLFQIEFLYEANFGLSPRAFRALLSVLFVPFFFTTLTNRARFFQLLENVWFYLFIAGNILLTYHYIHPS